jgi:hypothetical protein
MRSIADRWISPVELSARRVKAGQHDAPSRGHGCASRAIGCVGEVGKWGGCDSSPEAPGRGARGGGAQGASSRGLWRGEWGMHQGGGVLADRLRWCGYSRAHETQTAREVWLARGGQAALSSVMVWRRRRRSVQRFGSAEVWLPKKSVILIAMVVTETRKKPTRSAGSGRTTYAWRDRGRRDRCGAVSTQFYRRRLPRSTVRRR